MYLLREWVEGRGVKYHLLSSKTKSEEHTNEEKPDTGVAAEENIKTDKLSSEGKR